MAGQHVKGEFRRRGVLKKPSKFPSSKKFKICSLSRAASCLNDQGCLEPYEPSKLLPFLFASTVINTYQHPKDVDESRVLSAA